MRNARTFVFGLIFMCGLAHQTAAAASDKVDPTDQRCSSIATPAPAFFIDVLKKQMREALAQNDWEAIRPLIWDGADPEWTRDTKWQKRAAIEALNRDLVHAAATGNEQLILRLTRAGANVNAKAHYDDNMSPLIWAARCDQASATRLLLDEGADVNITAGYNIGSTGLVEGSSALMWAVRYGNISVIKVLLSRGANPNAQLSVIPDTSHPSTKEKGGTPLLQAVNNEAVELLLKAKANPNLIGLDDISPLMKAASDGDLNRCKLLLSWGANPHLKDRHGQTAADWAETANHPEIKELLARLP